MATPMHRSGPGGGERATLPAGLYLPGLRSERSIYDVCGESTGLVPWKALPALCHRPHLLAECATRPTRTPRKHSPGVDDA